MTGMIVSLLLIVMSISYPSLIFSGRLEEYSGAGIQMALFSAIVFCLVLSLLSTCPGVVGIAQGETAAVIGVATASIAEGYTSSGNPYQLLPTVMATVLVSSLLVAILFTLLGFFRLGNLIRFIPLPVMGGILAGVGWLLATGAFKSMTGLPFSILQLPDLFQPMVILKWMPGLLSALALMLLQHYRRSVFNLFCVLVVSVALFWLVASLLGVSQSTLGDNGWLMVWGNSQSNWVPFDYARFYSTIDWRAVFSQLPQLGTLLVIASISILMAASSLELLSRRDMDLNRELIAAGVGNFVCAATGSLPGYHSLGATTLSLRMGTPMRMVGLVGALVCAAAYTLGISFLSMLPKMLVGTVVLYVAVSLIKEWLYDTWFKLSRAEHFVLLLVFGCVCFIGLIKGVAAGLIAGLALFAFQYSRISVARQVGSSADFRSNVLYSEPIREVLSTRGQESYIMKLQGFIFFGTANGLLNQIRSRMRHSEPLRCAVLDFTHVSGIDSSAALSFLKLRQYAESLGFTIALSGVRPEIENSLRIYGMYGGSPSCVHQFDDLDHALEFCEMSIISAHMPPAHDSIYPIGEQLRKAFPGEGEAEAFMKHLQHISLSEGDYLIRQGDGLDDLFFIESGRVAVILERSEAVPLRLNAMGPGTIVGEIAFFLGPPRSATLVVETDLTAYRLSRESLKAIRRSDPALSIAFHEFMARVLAERLIEADRLARHD